MKPRTFAVLAVGLVAVIASLASGVIPSHAGGRVFVGVGVGAPFWYPYPYVYPYPVYSPPVVVQQQQPPVYVEAAPSAPSQPQYWYYCQSAQAYYPYVRECPAGWMQVVPQMGQPPQPPGVPR
jgi:hypothetical protein